MSLGAQFTLGHFQGIDNEGLVVPYGKLYFTDVFTGSPIITYKESGLEIENTHPVILTATGKADIFLASGEYDIVFKDADDQVIWSVENFVPVGLGDYSAWREDFTAEYAQTDFVATRDVDSNTLVYHEGLLLTETDDYTVIPDNTIRLLVAASLDDQVTLFGAAVTIDSSVIYSDGSVQMDSDYTPEEDKDIATKEFVENHEPELTSFLRKDGSIPLEEAFTPEDERDLVYKGYVDAARSAEVNIILNGDFVINNREFDGDWGGLLDDEWGYDRWQKSGTNIKQTLEEGTFVADTAYILSYKDLETPIGKTSPASGDWEIEVPLAEEEIQLELGLIATAFKTQTPVIMQYLCGYADDTETLGYRNIYDTYPPSLVVEDAEKVMVVDATGKFYELKNIIDIMPILPNAVLVINDTKASGVDGGTFTSSAWRTRDLNTEQYNEIEGASLSSNQITLPEGEYEVYATVPALQVDEHSSLLYNITDSANEIVGSVQKASDGSSVGNVSIIDGIITISDEKVFEIRHRCKSTRSTTGFGSSQTWGENIYTQIRIRKVG